MSIGKFLRSSSRTDSPAEIEPTTKRAGWSAALGRHASALRRAAAAALIAVGGLAGTADTASAQIVDFHPELTRVFHRELTHLEIMLVGS
ncbi:hypothetical protein [Paracoccus zhejiangensis]|uniref:Uncharacterized protein n=1 Tax=Paracoccus zhejiangensis TaxID=1077935 RepID=A0A2H5F350_9RHOB|nr:hypothetical protein [Paracoccus zhejiangensis]AUH65969.1 hypothetical protein CX676_18890 [Paracoccus zhejiangensis]